MGKDSKMFFDSVIQRRIAGRAALLVLCTIAFAAVPSQARANEQTKTVRVADTHADTHADAERVERERIRRNYLEQDRLQHERDDKTLDERRRKQLQPLQDADRARVDRLARLRARLSSAENCRKTHGPSADCAGAKVVH